MEGKYYTTIGLEVHAELKTNTKMFCSCKNDQNEIKSNINICPVCTAHPGALPVPNKKAIENVIKMGLAVGGEIADFTEFDRKNYFYPDIPKGYQISQYKYPIVKGGKLNDFDITRIHLEEDTGNNKHKEGTDVGRQDKETSDVGYSLIDFNRAGIPLMELVTEPKTFRTKEEASLSASEFAKELQLIMWYLDISEANMEKGEMRVEVNISISEDKEKLGTKVEIKNLNSFRSVAKAILYEAQRMEKLIEDGKKEEIIHETRGWDENKSLTFSQRKKEESHDYRYFPDPDLPKMKLHEVFVLEKMREELKELPKYKRERYKKDFSFKGEDIEVYINNKYLGDYLENIANKLVDVNKIKIASNYIITDYLGLKKADPLVNLPSEENFLELINMINENKISSRTAKDILAMIVKEDDSPLKIAQERNLLQKNDEGEVKIIVEKIVLENQDIVEIYKKGKENAIMSLVGKAIKESKGSANPEIVIKLLKELIK